MPVVLSIFPAAVFIWTIFDSRPPVCLRVLASFGLLSVSAVGRSGRWWALPCLCAGADWQPAGRYFYLGLPPPPPSAAPSGDSSLSPELSRQPAGQRQNW